MNDTCGKANKFQCFPDAHLMQQKDSAVKPKKRKQIGKEEINRIEVA